MSKLVAPDRVGTTLSEPPTGDPFRYRDATAADIKRLLRVERKCFLRIYRPHRFLSRDFKAYINTAHAVALAVWSRTRIVGYVAGVTRDETESGVARLDSLAVLPEARGRGVASELTRRFILRAQSAGCPSIALEVGEGNRSARELYMKMGFEDHGRLNDFYAPGIHAIEMKLNL